MELSPKKWLLFQWPSSESWRRNGGYPENIARYHVLLGVAVFLLEYYINVGNTMS